MTSYCETNSIISTNNNNMQTNPSTMQTNPSICIPRTFSNVTWQLVKDAFDEIFGQGYVERVDVVNKADRRGNEFKKIFIHFTKWPETEEAQRIRQALIDGKTIKIVYQFPWYWKCVMSNVPKRTWNGQKPYAEIMGEDMMPACRDEELGEMEEGGAHFDAAIPSGF